jgi:hypothetical protein
MQVRGNGEDGLMDEGQASSSAAGEKVMYILHPNVAVEEM